MASPEQILEVRRNADEPDETTYTDEEISGLIDVNGVTKTTAILWKQKAARFSRLVDITEGSSSRKNSQKYQHALDMAAAFGGGSATGGARIHSIER